ncbi:tRNA CCA-pyrophosphorylase [Secundilactobacillus oryzae JCM 18671]|uniref:CCA-adding enzyme n=1 Tax=Secundilactobacillus oryzae JCM 18671 TaxID=1291743 RepID=A0A081BH93_9LACO|nr:CCA tRNA nucleotidyltransferase [Secundilactobacillus oryzae]GAK47411.1 tRNA CCA-pyrophosphorylase [Secundilactobacillus oryzae JCM 18671]
MKIEKIPTEFEQARPIMQTIEAAGYEAYFVGGSVRDTLLHKPIHDVDIATSAFPEEVKQLFHKTVDTGIEHGTVMILDHGIGYETTTFRTESTYQDYRRPDSVTFVRSLAEDLKRRDFTINALAMHEDGEIIDLFSGLQDLDNGVIRAVGNPEERFNEDALRMMRAVRFASQLNFTIETKTTAAIASHAELLEKIAIERIQVEFVKMLMGQAPQMGLTDFLETGLYRYCPGLADGQDLIERLRRLDHLQLASEVAVWTVMVYLLDLDHVKTTKFLKAWKNSNQIIDATHRANAALHGIMQDSLDNWLCYETGEEDLMTAADLAALLGKTVDQSALMAQYQALQIKAKGDLEITGQDLMAAGVQPGPMMGKLLAQIERKVVNNELTNEKEQLLRFVRDNK